MTLEEGKKRVHFGRTRSIKACAGRRPGARRDAEERMLSLFEPKRWPFAAAVFRSCTAAVLSLESHCPLTARLPACLLFISCLCLPSMLRLGSPFKTNTSSSS